MFGLVAARILPCLSLRAMPQPTMKLDPRLASLEAAMLELQESQNRSFSELMEKLDLLVTHAVMAYHKAETSGLLEHCAAEDEGAHSLEAKSELESPEVLKEADDPSRSESEPQEDAHDVEPKSLFADPTLLYAADEKAIDEATTDFAALAEEVMGDQNEDNLS